jgi:hypothetical protein
MLTDKNMSINCEGYIKTPDLMEILMKTSQMFKINCLSNQDFTEIKNEDENEDENEINEINEELPELESESSESKVLCEAFYDMGNDNYLLNGNNLIKKAWFNFTSVKVTGSDLEGNRNGKIYTIYFPCVSNSYPLMELVNEQKKTIENLVKNHSYPVCNCPSYHYRSYQTLGACKHIYAVLCYVHIDLFHAINWSNRPNNLAEPL